MPEEDRKSLERAEVKIEKAEVVKLEPFVGFAEETPAERKRRKNKEYRAEAKRRDPEKIKEQSRKRWAEWKKKNPERSKEHKNKGDKKYKLLEKTRNPGKIKKQQKEAYERRRDAKRQAAMLTLEDQRSGRFTVEGSWSKLGLSKSVGERSGTKEGRML